MNTTSTKQSATLSKIIDSLAAVPEILAEILENVPTEHLRKRRIPNKWTIHEHACHIAIGDQYVFHPRMEAFINDPNPTFSPYSGTSFAEDFLINMDLGDALEQFALLRKKSISYAQNLDPALWNKEAIHLEYTRYTPKIMLRHFLMHDYFHMYRIEELLLTKDEFLP